MAKNAWMDRYKSSDPKYSGGLGLKAYNRMRDAGYSNQQIVSGARHRGLTIGQRVRDETAYNTGAQPNWMNQYTGSEGNIGLSTYERMKGAGYNVLDIQRDQPASGMIFGKLAQEQMGKDLVSYYENEKAQQLEKHAPPQMTTAGAGDIGAGANALGVKTAIPSSDMTVGSTTDAFGRDREDAKAAVLKKKKEVKSALPTSGLTA